MWCDCIQFDSRFVVFRRVHGSLQLLFFVSHLPSTQHDTHPITHSTRVIIIVGASAHCFQWQTSHKYAHFNEGLFFWLNFEEHQKHEKQHPNKIRWQLTKIGSFDEIPSRDSSSDWLDDACINIVTQSAFYLQAKFKLTLIQAPMNHRLILWWIWFFLTKESINFLCGNCLTF